MIEIVPARQHHCGVIAANMRRSDADEVAAASGASPLSALEAGLACSTAAWTALEDGEAICMFGVGAPSLLSDQGAPWMLGTGRVERHGRRLVVEGRRYVGEMLALHPRLLNFVDERNAAAKRWLARLGFALGEPEPFGVASLPFRPFRMTADV